MYVQAWLLAAVACTAEVSALKQDLERSETKLGLTKRQLEENKGKQYLCLYIEKEFGCKVIGSSWICQGPRPKWRP